MDTRLSITGLLLVLLAVWRVTHLLWGEDGPGDIFVRLRKEAEHCQLPGRRPGLLQELCINLRRKLARPLPAEQVRRLIQDYMSWEIVVNTAESVIQALEIEVRYKISFWDALVLQAAESSGAAILYSEDLSAGQGYGTMRGVNPLLG